MTLVKICGISSSESVALLDGMVDYLGFVSSKMITSLRTLEPAAVTALARIASRSRTVAVLHGYTVEEAAGLANTLEVDVVQFHGPLAPREAASLAGALEPVGTRLALVVEWSGDTWRPMNPCLYIEELHGEGLMPEYVLLDATKGLRARLPLAEAAKALPCAESRGIALGAAGGLKPGGTACEAARLGFHLIDVSRGVEEAPGRKDPLLAAEIAFEARRCKP